MCGISGTFGFADKAVIQAMNNAMSHRGPDDSGIFIDTKNQFALGHVRLSIIDTSAFGHQPMSYAGGKYWITLNGEIYNYRELREELAALGHRFQSNSDTEVVLAAYCQWRDACVKKLDGMFAFAIFDFEDGADSQPSLFLARDRLGIKPLYYFYEPGIFCFSSEVKGMLASSQVRRKVDLESLAYFQIYGSVPQPHTILEDVRMLPAGHVMRVRTDTPPMIDRFWDPTERVVATAGDIKKLSREDIGQHVKELLLAATRRHLVADVPVGAFLSGGIDSSAVAALMAQAVQGPIKTYSIGFISEGGMRDELHWANRVADYMSCEHSSAVISGKHMANCYTSFINALDQPSVDGANTFLVSQLVGQEVKVVLSGLGGDEIFAGYPHFVSNYNLERWSRNTKFLNQRLSGLFARLFTSKLGADSHLLGLSRSQRYSLLRNLCGRESMGKDLNSWFDPASRIVDSRVFANAVSMPEFGTIASLSIHEINNYLVNTLLRDVDALSMFHSLEVRPVLLDHHLVEFLLSIPGDMQLSPKVNKPMLVQAVRGSVPEDVLSRDKTGFELPLTEWLKKDLNERACDGFSGAMASDVFSESYIKQTLASLSGSSTPKLRTWSSLNLIEWLGLNRCYL